MLNRRACLAVLGSLVLLPLWRKPAAAAWAVRPATGNAAAVTALVGLFSCPDDARAVGRRYLAQYPERNDLAVVLGDLGEELTAAAARGDASLRQRVAGRQRQDFDKGDTVMVGNWMLSRTEAGLCALAALC